MKTSIKYKLEIHLFTEEDDYREGCKPETTRDFGVIETMYYSTIEQLQEFLLDSKVNYSIFDSVINYNILVNADNYEASERDLEQWKEGKRVLWLANYTYYITKVVETSFENEELAAMFPHLENQGV